MSLKRIEDFTDIELLQMKEKLYDNMIDNPSFLDTYIFTQVYDDLMEFEALEKEVIKRHLPSLNPEELTEQIKIDIAKDFYSEMQDEEIKGKCKVFEDGDVSYSLNFVSYYTMRDILKENEFAFIDNAKNFLEEKYGLDPDDFGEFDNEVGFDKMMSNAINDLIENGYILVEPEYGYPEDIRNNNYEDLDIPFVLKEMNEKIKQSKGMQM